MVDSELPREEQLVAFFVTKCAGKRALGRTQLMKLLYLADYEARRYLGRPISGLDYVWHHFGPYDDRFLSAIGVLETHNLVREERVMYPTGKEGYRYRPGGSTNISYGFAPIELEILRHVCTTYSDLKLQALLADVVYETEPMLEAKANDARGERLNMEMLNGVKRYEHGISFEELHSRIQAVRAGDFVPHVDVMRSLRQQQHAAA